MNWFGLTLPSWIADVIRVLTSGVTGELSAFLVGILAGALAVAFTLGGLWALRGRPTLITPRCRRCSVLLRGSGRATPDVCPECGSELTRPAAVSWLRFRRQPLTIGITAPVVLLGGGLLALWAALEVVRTVDSSLRRWQRTQAVLHAPADDIVSAGEPAGTSDDSRVFRSLVDIGRVPGIGPPRLAPPTLTARVAAYRGKRYLGMVSIAGIVEALQKDHPKVPATGAEVELVRELVREILCGGPLVPSGPGRRINQIDALPDGIALIEALLELGYIDEEWIHESIRLANESFRVVVAPNVNPGGIVGVRVVDEFGGRVHNIQLQSVLRGDEEILVARPPQFSSHRIAHGAFLAPEAVGNDEVIVTWEGPFLSWVVNDDPLRLGTVHVGTTTRSVTLRYDVVEGAELLPLLTDPARDPMAAPSSELQLTVRDCGSRDVLVMSMTNWTTTQALGRWRVLIEGEWRDVSFNPFGIWTGRQGVLVQGPAGHWPESVTVRFDPMAGVSDRLPTMPATILNNPMLLFSSALPRAFDSAWGASREYTLVRDDQWLRPYSITYQLPAR